MISTSLRFSTGTVFLQACPVHGELVGFDAGDRLIGRCSGCSAEAARAIRAIDRRELPVQLLLRSEA